MSTAFSLAEIQAVTYDVTWSAKILGYVKDINPQNMEPIRLDKTVGQFGQLVLDRVHLGPQNPTVTMTFNQVADDIIRALCPWAGSSGAFSLQAPRFYSEYANAGILNLHPHGVDPAVLTDDLYFPKAFPNIKMANRNAPQTSWAELPVTFNLYFDQSLLSANNVTVGYYGGPPS